MNNYRISIMNNITKEAEIIMTMQRPRFTRREYTVAIREMFFLAAKSIDYRSLTAEIYCNDVHTMSIDCETVKDFARINALVSTSGKFLRNMCIAY